MNNNGLDDGGGKASPVQYPVRKIAWYNNICTASSMTGAVAQNDWSNNSQSSTNGTDSVLMMYPGLSLAAGGWVCIIITSLVDCCWLQLRL
jgi:hypothetical protein